MTPEHLHAALALSVYDSTPVEGVRVAWSGAINHIQFDILYDDGSVYVCFAGTNEWADMYRHLWVKRQKIGDVILVHRGWLADFQRCIPAVYAVLREQLTHNEKEVVFVGHSYGGALAQLAAWYYAHELIGCRCHLRTYGSPRAGNSNFAKDLDNRISTHYRYVVKGDPVPQTPLAFRYAHGGTQILMPFHRSPHSMAGYLKSIIGNT